MKEPLRLLLGWQHGSAGTDALSLTKACAESGPALVQGAVIVTQARITGALSKLDRRYSQWLKEAAHREAETAICALVDSGLPQGSLADPPAIGLDAKSESAGIELLASSFNADLILLGSHSESPKGRFRAGSTADTLLHSAHTPVMLTPRGYHLPEGGISQVSVAFVDTPESQQALDLGIRLAQQWSVDLRLVAFAPRPERFYIIETGFDSTEELMFEWTQQAYQHLENGRKRVATIAPELHVDTAVGGGVGWAGAIAGVSWKPSGILVIGSSELGNPLRRVFVGSTATHIINNAPVPVVVQRI